MSQPQRGDPPTSSIPGDLFEQWMQNMIPGGNQFEENDLFSHDWSALDPQMQPSIVQELVDVAGPTHLDRLDYDFTLTSTNEYQPIGSLPDHDLGFSVPESTVGSLKSSPVELQQTQPPSTTSALSGPAYSFIIAPAPTASTSSSGMTPALSASTSSLFTTSSLSTLTPSSALGTETKSLLDHITPARLTLKTSMAAQAWREGTQTVSTEPDSTVPSTDSEKLEYVAQLVEAMADVTDIEDNQGQIDRFMNQLVDEDGDVPHSAYEALQAAAWHFMDHLMDYHARGGPDNATLRKIGRLVPLVIRNGEGSFARHVNDLAGALRTCKTFTLRALDKNPDRKVREIANDLDDRLAAVRRERTQNTNRAAILKVAKEAKETLEAQKAQAGGEAEAAPKGEKGSGKGVLKKGGLKRKQAEISGGEEDEANPTAAGTSTKRQRTKAVEIHRTQQSPLINTPVSQAPRIDNSHFTGSRGTHTFANPHYVQQHAQFTSQINQDPHTVDGQFTNAYGAYTFPNPHNIQHRDYIDSHSIPDPRTVDDQFTNSYGAHSSTDTQVIGFGRSSFLDDTIVSRGIGYGAQAQTTASGGSRGYPSATQLNQRFGGQYSNHQGVAYAIPQSTQAKRYFYGANGPLFAPSASNEHRSNDNSLLFNNGLNGQSSFGGKHCYD